MTQESLSADQSISTGPRFAIRRIIVRGLFGTFNYNLPDYHANEGRFDDIAILYGDNGTGKTTILRMIYYLLSPDDNKGYRTEILSIPFRRFCLELEDGTEIDVSRQKPIRGAYRLSISRDNEPICSVHVEKDDRVRVKPASERDKYIQYLRSRSASLFFLGADRAELPTGLAVTDPGGAEFIGTRPPDTYVISEWSDAGAIARRVAKGNDQRKRLHEAMDAVKRWTAQQTVRATNVGTQGATAIYAEVIQSISRSIPHRGAAQPVDALLLELHQLRERTDGFVRFGLTSPFDIDRLHKAIANVSPSAAKLMDSILQPYLESTKARLDALESTRSLLERLIYTFEKFFMYKQVNFHVSSGLSIRNLLGEEVPPWYLSSGEQQLLLLLCRIVVSHDEPSIYIIDEPELSLNVKWQRMLVSSLSDLLKDSSSQMIFATHSLELLAQHRSKVVKLAPEIIDVG